MCRVKTLLMCLAFAIIARSVQAEDRLHDFHVLGIGLTEYKKNPGDTLRTAVPDVQALTKLFLDQDHPGASETLRRTKTFYNAAATKKAIEQQLADLPNWVSEGSTLAIVYAGHGERFGGHWFLLPYDIDVNHIEETSVSGETLMNAVDAVIAKKHCRVIVILNSCHSGEILNAAEPLLAKYRTPDQGGLILMAACTPGQVTYFSRFGGVFTSAILTGLKGQEAHVGPTESVSLGEISRYLRSNVQQRLRSEVWKAPGIAWPEQNLLIEHSQSISEDIGITAADRKHVSAISTSIGSGTTAMCSVVKTQHSPVGLWRCVRPLMIKPSPLMSSEPTIWLQMNGHYVDPAKTEPTFLADDKGNLLVDVVALQFFEDGHYEVAYKAPSSDLVTASGRYRFQSGVEFSLKYDNGTDYFSLSKLDSKELVLRVGSSLGCSVVRSDPELRFERVETNAK